MVLAFEGPRTSIRGCECLRLSANSATSAMPVSWGPVIFCIRCWLDPLARGKLHGTAGVNWEPCLTKIWWNLIISSSNGFGYKGFLLLRRELGATVCALVLLVAVLRFVLCSFEDKASQSNPNILSGV